MALLALKLSELLVLFYLVVVFIRKIHQTKKKSPTEESQPARDSKKITRGFRTNNRVAYISFDHFCG